MVDTLLAGWVGLEFRSFEVPNHPAKSRKVPTKPRPLKAKVHKSRVPTKLSFEHCHPWFTPCACLHGTELCAPPHVRRARAAGTGGGGWLPAHGLPIGGPGALRAALNWQEIRIDRKTTPGFWPSCRNDPVDCWFN